MSENSEVTPNLDPLELRQWQLNIEEANRNNIFCHCHSCGYEWVDSQTGVQCKKCGSIKVESISCWQFPDD